MNRVVNCQTPWCGAKVNYDTRWVVGFFPKNGTSIDFTSTGSVKEHHCPMCRKELPTPEQNLPPYQEPYVGTM